EDEYGVALALFDLAAQPLQRGGAVRLDAEASDLVRQAECVPADDGELDAGIVVAAAQPADRRAAQHHRECHQRADELLLRLDVAAELPARDLRGRSPPFHATTSSPTGSSTPPTVRT